VPFTIRKSEKLLISISFIPLFIHLCCVCFSADGRYLATGCNRTTQIFDVQTGGKICVISDESTPKSTDLYIRSVRFSPDGKLIATGAEDHKIRNPFVCFCMDRFGRLPRNASATFLKAMNKKFILSTSLMTVVISSLVLEMRLCVYGI